MGLKQSKHPNVRAFLTIAALAVAAGVVSGCGGSAAPAQPISGTTPTPRPSVSPTARPTATASPTPTATATALARPASIFIGNFGASNVVSFPATGTGNLAPTTTLTGSGVLAPYLIYVDGSGDLWSANRLLATVTAYAPGASGSAAPIVSLAGLNTGFAIPIGVYTTAAGTIFVTDAGSDVDGSIRIFSPESNGNVAPANVIAGSNTTFNGGQPAGIWLDGSSNIYVTNFNQASVDIFAAGASGNAVPVQIITGSATLLSSPLGLTLDSAANIYVANPGGHEVLVFAAGSNGNVAPSRVISGANTLLSYPAAIAVDASGYIYVGDAVNNSILVFAPGANGNVAPVQNISGSNTGLNNLRGLAIR